MNPPPALMLFASQRLFDLRERQSIRHQFAGIQLNLIFARRPAKGIHVDDVGNGLQLVHHDPVIQRLQFHHVVLRIGAGQRVEHDLAGGTVVGPDGRIHAAGQGHQLQAIEHFLPRIEGGDVVVVNDGDDRQAHQRHGTQMRQVRHAVEFHFQRNGDLLFDFFGGVPGPLRDDLRVGVGDVGIGLDGQVRETKRCPRQKAPAQRPESSGGCAAQNRSDARIISSPPLRSRTPARW